MATKCHYIYKNTKFFGKITCTKLNIGYAINLFIVKIDLFVDFLLVGFYYTEKNS